jgi:hypothetical protein
MATNRLADCASGWNHLAFVRHDDEVAAMHRHFFSLRIAALVVLAAIVVASIDLYARGFAVVHDPDGLIERAMLDYGDGADIAMREFASGYWAARPGRDGVIRIECRTGAIVAGGYVTPGLRTTYSIGRKDCDGVAGRRSRA